MTSNANFDLERIWDAPLRRVGEKVLDGIRLDDADAVTMFRSPDLLGLGALASHVNQRLHGDVVTFAANQHINPTNVCYLRKTCVFCSFARLPKEDGAYRYTMDQILAEAAPAQVRIRARMPIRTDKAIIFACLSSLKILCARPKLTQEPLFRALIFWILEGPNHAGSILIN